MYSFTSIHYVHSTAAYRYHNHYHHCHHHNHDHTHHLWQLRYWCNRSGLFVASRSNSSGSSTGSGSHACVGRLGCHRWPWYTAPSTTAKQRLLAGRTHKSHSSLGLHCNQLYLLSPAESCKMLLNIILSHGAYTNPRARLAEFTPFFTRFFFSWK